MSRWFRHYAGMMRDDKLVRAAMKSKQPVERVVWIWGAILESASEINDAGRYELDEAEIAYFLRSDEADIHSIIAALGDGGRIADGHVVHWGDRQFASDRSAERQRRHRENKKTIGNGDGGPDQQSVRSDSDAEVDRVRFVVDWHKYDARGGRPAAEEWEQLRDFVFRRDDFTCSYCGNRGGRLECDHIDPVARGGSNGVDNLTTACFNCNRSKRDRTVKEWRQ